MICGWAGKTWEHTRYIFNGGRNRGMTVLTRMRETLREEIRRAVLSAGLATEENIPEVELEIPREKAHGDLATNMAMKLTRIARANPREIAARIVERIDREKGRICDIQVAGPGVINFVLDRSVFTEELDE